MGAVNLGGSEKKEYFSLNLDRKKVSHVEITFELEAKKKIACDCETSQRYSFPKSKFFPEENADDVHLKSLDEDHYDPSNAQIEISKASR